MQIEIIFPYSICVGGPFLLATGIAKCASAIGMARILDYSDPVLVVLFGDVFSYSGSSELFAASVCFDNKNAVTASGIMVCSATHSITYRSGLIWICCKNSCSCLHNLEEAKV
jgi:hypothetical protein